MIAFAVSFVGSIPPGTINLTVLQLAMQGRKSAALSFGLAAAIVEYGYAAIAIRFQIYLMQSADINFWFKLVSGSVLLLLGIYNLLKTPKEGQRNELKGEKRNAFVKGAMVGLTNPLSIPFWLAVTAYLDTMGWIALDHNNFWLFVTGISAGTFSLLFVVTYFGAKIQSLQKNPFILYKLPGILFIAMGIWTFLN
ncbi:MAG: LysE family transporter [Reichenbachiella sp.]